MAGLYAATNFRMYLYRNNFKVSKIEKETTKYKVVKRSVLKFVNDTDALRRLTEGQGFITYHKQQKHKDDSYACGNETTLWESKC